MCVWPFQVRLKMVRHKEKSACCQTYMTFGVGPFTLCLLISAVWPFRGVLH